MVMDISARVASTLAPKVARVDVAPTQLDRIKAELSEGPVTPSYDPNTGPAEHLLIL